MKKLILPNLKDKTFILIGEIHGVKENLDVLKILIRACLNINKLLLIALEWPADLTNEVNSYLFGKTTLGWQKWDFIKYKDGRISKEHLDFLKWLKRANSQPSRISKIGVQCFDVTSKNWDARDREMSNILLRVGENKKRKTLAIMGNLHARKTGFFLGKKKHKPLGSYLPEGETLAVRLNYLSGYFYNNSIKKFSSREGINFVHNPTVRRSKKGSGYDYDLYITRAHPVKPLST